MARKPNPEIRDEILRQAEHLIHLHGFHSTTLDDIAKACRMTKANLFHHYGSKEELGLAVLDQKVEEYRSRKVGPLCGGNDPVAQVGQMFADCGKFYDGNGCKAGCFIGNIALEMSDLSETFRKRVSAFFEEWTQGMEDCLKRSRDAGFFDADLDPRAAAEAILSLYEGAIMMARAKRDATVFARVGRQAQSLLEQHRAKRRKNDHGTQDPLRVLTRPG
jgi:TetR/AcrR family transcriptional regulator, transcriptional repressor for nem operon